MNGGAKKFCITGTSYLSRQEIVKTAESRERMLAYLNERVNYTDIGAGVEHFVEVGLSVNKL